MNNISDELLLLEDVARVVRASLGTVRFWIATGKLRSFRLGRRRVVYRRELDRFIQDAAGRTGRP